MLPGQRKPQLKIAYERKWQTKKGKITASRLGAEPTFSLDHNLSHGKALKLFREGVRKT